MFAVQTDWFYEFWNFTWSTTELKVWTNNSLQQVLLNFNTSWIFREAVEPSQAKGVIKGPSIDSVVSKSSIFVLITSSILSFLINLIYVLCRLLGYPLKKTQVLKSQFFVMSVCKNPSKVQNSASLLVEISILIEFYELTWYEKKKTFKLATFFKLIYGQPRWQSIQFGPGHLGMFCKRANFNDGCNIPEWH